MRDKLIGAIVNLFKVYILRLHGSAMNRDEVESLVNDILTALKRTTGEFFHER